MRKGLLTLLTLLLLTQPAHATAQPTCGTLGTAVGGSALGAIPTCCQGLTPASAWHHRQLEKNPALSCQELAATPPVPGNQNICTACGDGKCNNETLEDKCNCPTDCK